MKRFTAWLASLLVLALLAGCADAGGFVKDHYPLVDVQGKGKDIAKVYMAEGQHVPEVASQLASEESPKETSKTSDDQMFLVYDDKIINIQKDPQNADNSLVEIDTVSYAKEHYDSSFLQGYLTATILQSLFGGGWYSGGGGHSGSYRGWTSTARVNQTPYEETAKKQQPQPATTSRSGSFTSKGNVSSSNSSTSTSTNKNSESSGSFTSGTSGTVRKNDGSTPTYKSPTVSKPKTSSRSGSFSRRR